MRKSQVSLFIILGLALLVLAGLIAFLYDLSAKDRQRQLDDQYAIKDSMKPVKDYVESCIIQSAREPIKRIGLNGGTLDPIFHIYHQGDRLNLLAFREPNIGINSLLTRQDMEKELAMETRSRAEGCIDLGIFVQQGFQIEQGSLELDASISRSKVSFAARYPLTFTKANQTLKIEDYSADFSVPLGEAFETAIMIVNEELSKGHFDQLDFMKTHSDYIIEKHRPYPHIIYLINRSGYAFRFAIEGEDTANQPGFSPDAKSGCCMSPDSMCYANAGKESCETKGGSYLPLPCSCNPPTIPTKTCDGCKSCRTDGSTRASGESWCSYDSITGDGYDYVGSRHYVNYCIDGILYEEECRDYREEICVQEGTRAVCRPNRWQDCSACLDRSCCEDSEWRDCIWKDWISAKGKCVAQVPPGLKFWDSSAANICASGSELKTCDGWSCPAVWVDDSAMYCYMRGDCGAYRNIADTITYAGHFSTDFGSLPRAYIYHKDGEHMKGDNYVLKLGADNRKQRTYDGGFAEAQNTIVMMISSAYSYLNEISSLSISDFLNPFKPKPKIRVMSASICSPWVAPMGSDDCSKCADRTCTEYRCRSLGQACVFENIDGFPTCEAAPADKTPPKIIISEDFLPQRYNAEMRTLRISDKTYKGYEITPALRPHRVFSIGIQTDEDTTCRLAYTPRLKHISLPSFGFGDSSFSRRHSIMLRVPESADVPEKMLAAMNMTRLSEILDMLERPKDMMQNYKSRFAGPLAAYRFVTGKDLTNVIDPIISDLAVIVEKLTMELPFYRDLSRTLLERFEDGGLYLFVTCTDRSGNVNSEEMFISISIDKNLNDTEPPLILGLNPANGSSFANSLESMQISAFLDEPSSCRHSQMDKPYEEMESEMQCQRGKYDLSPHFGGSYVCSSTLGLNDLTEAFIRCSDNPTRTDKHQITVSRGWKAQASPESKYLNITENELWASASMLSGARAVMNLSPFVLQLNMEESMNCSYSYGNATREFGTCMPANDLDIGQYACRGEIEFAYVEDRAIELFKASETLPTDGITVSDTVTINLSQYASGQLWMANSRYAIILNGSHSCIAYNGSGLSNLTCSAGEETSCAGDFTTDFLHVTCLAETELAVNITCRERSPKMRNTNEESYRYVLYRSDKLLISDHGPKDESGPDTTVFAVTNKNASCEYSLGMLLTRTPMARDGTRHEARLSGLSPGRQTYRVHCTDEFGNAAEVEDSFQVLGG